LSWLAVALLCWSAAFAWHTELYLVFALALGSCLLCGFWLRAARSELARFALLAFSSLALLGVSLILNVDAQRSANQNGFNLWPFEQLRQASKLAMFGVSADAEALTLGLAVGDSSLASESLLSAMRDTSLTHLVAVSGSNCAIVSGAVFLALRQLGVRVRVFGSLIALGCYVLLVGSQPSVLRAATMAAAVLLAYLSGRRVKPIVALSIAITALLIASPQICIEYGFSLSVAATAGILLLAPKIYERLKARMPRWVALALAVSAAAQLLCFPILLQLQPRVPTYSLLAVLAILAVLLSWFQPLASLLFWVASIPASLIAVIAHTFSNMPLATAFWLPGLLGAVTAVALVAAAVTFVVSRHSETRLISGTVAAALMVTSVSMLTVEAVRLAAWPQPQWQIASCDVGQGDATVIKTGSSVAVIDVGKFDSKINRCLTQLGVTEIDLLVLTHFDQDHVLGINGALNGRRVEQVLVSPFLDDRPAAISTMAALKKHSVAVVKAHKWLSGTLGSTSWTVLSPTRTAQEAEDSNDASIAMLFRFDDFSLLTLADLGEKGQMRLAQDLDIWHRGWVASHDLVLKVSHHGSADQYPEFIEHLNPSVSLISAGAENGYGHPTQRTLRLLERTKTLICRTDLLGSIALTRVSQGFTVANTAAG
jgi:competence protein ComEC